MTSSQRLFLADSYAQSLSEGRIEDLSPILEAAQTDPELARLVVAISRGDAEEHGTALAPEDRDRIAADLAGRLAAATAPARPAPGAQTFLVALRDATDLSMTQAAEAMDTTVEFCDDANTYWKVHPDPRVQALSHVLVAKARAVHTSIPTGVLEDGFETDPSYAMAAYADGNIDRNLPTFEEMLEDSGMTDEQQARWTQAVEDYLRQADSPA